jgi:HK97 family phage prohead protease
MSRIEELREFLPSVDADLQRFFPFQIEKVSATGNKDDPAGTYFVRGLASVYNQWSLDLGGFRERVLPGAFDDVLQTDGLHVLHVWDHDTSKTLSSTRNGTLELKSVADGLQYYSKVAPTSYAADLRILLTRGDIDQSSFAFTVEDDEWRVITEGDTEVVERDIRKVDGLYDVTTCAMGAYPQTTSALAVRSIAAGRKAAVAIPRDLVASTEEGPEADAAPDEVGPEEQVAPEKAGELTPPEDREARERERELWRQTLMAEHRRTREFVFGVNNDEGDKR